MPLFGGRCRSNRSESRQGGIGSRLACRRQASACVSSSTSIVAPPPCVPPPTTPTLSVVKSPNVCLPSAPAAQLPVYDPSPTITEQNPVSEAEIAATLKVYDPSSSEALDIEKDEDGSTIVKFQSSDANFRVGYITHDKAFSSPGQSYSDANRVSKSEIAGRYSLSVRKLENGEFEYTLKMHPNLSGALLEIGNSHYTISASESLRMKQEQQLLDRDSSPSAPKTLRETIRQWNNFTEFSPSDRFPAGIDYLDVAPLNEYLVLSERKADPNSKPLSQAEENRMGELRTKYQHLIQKFDLPVIE